MIDTLCKGGVLEEFSAICIKTKKCIVEIQVFLHLHM